MTAHTRIISAMGILLALLCGAIHHVSGKTVRGTEPVSVQKKQPTAKPKPADINFEKQIAPLLAKRCLECHSGNDPKGGLNLTTRELLLKGGENGRSTVPGNFKKSLLWQRIDDCEMPPKTRLPDSEQRLLERWIKEGVKWGKGPIDGFRFTTTSRAGYDWWALQPVTRPNIPDTKQSSWLRNPIDAFVLAKLESLKLTPSRDASKRNLLRRLSFDLLGLPPSENEIRKFLTDDSPNAYEKLVDRLLASPHYGERWARHWLDIVHFGESQGFERDKLRENSWRYRDWVVRALDSDMPYDQFAKQQLAGDAISPGNPNSVIATGFLVSGPYDEVGQSQQSAAMRAIVRQDELEDVVGLVGQTFLGLTVNCARCHDHKFDPVRQKEYYQLTAALAGVRHGERNIGNAEIRRNSAEQSRMLQSQIDTLSNRIAQGDASTKQRILVKHKSKPERSVNPPKPIADWDFRKSLKDNIGGLHVTLNGNAKRDGNGLRLDGKTGFASTGPLKQSLKTKTLEAWIQLDNLQQRGGGVISVQTLNGVSFDAIVFGEREPTKWMPGSNGFVRTQSFQGVAETVAVRQLVHVAIAYDANGTIRGYRNGRPYGRPYHSTGPAAFQTGQAQVVFGLRHSPAGGNHMLAGNISRAKLYNRALTAREIAASAGVTGDFVSHEELIKNLTPEEQALREQRQFEIDRLTEKNNRVKRLSSYAAVSRQPKVSHLLIRGNPSQKGLVVKPAGVDSLLGVNADFGLKPNAPEAERRIKLADWITHSRNPLFARVIVNRLWQFHFGSGIVETPSDFGFNGGRPSHQKLLDWLAVELVRSGWSLKQIHRLIVTSATYRQSSMKRNSAVKVDAGNRYLWRKNPTRLDAESIRDAILSVAGLLNPSMAGPGYFDFITSVRNTQFYKMHDPVGHEFHRRSLYRTWVRSGRNQFLDVFDCPDPSTKTPKRAVTITPLQALSLLNNSFVLRMSNTLANRIRKETGNNVSAQVARAWQLAYGRSPDADETRTGTAFVNQHGLFALCRVLFNSSEFLYVD